MLVFLPTDKVGLENPEIIVRDVSECRSTLHIAHGIDSRYIGFEKLIDADEPFGICGDTGSCQVERFGIRYATGSDKQVRPGEYAFSAGGLDGQPHAGIRRFGDPDGFGCQQDLDSIFL